ncbi:MAG: enoyl-CoA hydratase/isomerase family protein [Desulfobacteraceae bacterium]|nr:enoyl-CoA hydratase/isomerase family protein [Desulfobacteraceae bacterium]MBC2756380.1 enoyl-CoA hydratase/isomerase family protein [Desulfobacteraceae bacterium]
MNSPPLLIDKQDHIATVTLNRPEKGNALSMHLMEEIIGVAEAFHSDLETRVVIFKGAGKHFCLGADLKDPRQFAAADGPLLARQRSFNTGPRMIRALMEMNQITIAALHGLTLGGGACIATALDFRTGTTDCRVGFPEINLGIPLSWISLPLCVRLIGPARAKRFVILGEKEDADTLVHWGFLDDIAEKDRLMSHAMKMAESYAKKAPIPAQMIKRSINAIASALDQAVMHMDTDQVLLAQSAVGFQEGIKTVFEK